MHAAVFHISQPSNSVCRDGGKDGGKGGSGMISGGKDERERKHQQTQYTGRDE